ncbi:helix-turn-helix domain-containing protein [Streptomyces sp. NPDC051001]|uniref:helix-turn-helix domain-containing protein n=1 Tax=Streptomyces sp. NPDC051001 TaxID=3155795 RepID=UPI00342C7F5A
MDELTAAEAAAYLGITREAVDLAAREDRLPAAAKTGPRRFSAEAVEAFHQLKQAQLTAALARTGETPVSVARRVRKRLHSDSETGLPRPFATKLASMPVDWRTLFSKAELAAACTTDGCRWCEARKFANFLGLRPVEFSPALRELFGADPCQACRPALLGPYMAALAARVHAGDRRPPGPPPRATEAERQAALEWVRERAVTAAAPVVQDDGREWVARRLRQTREKLKAARRSGDREYQAQLMRTLQSLTADAAAVDGGASAAPRGRKACGTPVGVRCECHTSDRRGQR